MAQDEGHRDGQEHGHRAHAMLRGEVGPWDGRDHLAIVETRLGLALERGRHTESVSELTALTAAHPLREGLREQLMLALYRSGRQAEALAVYADTRRLLAEELGVTPSARLTELQRRILQGDAGLAVRGAAVAPGLAGAAPVTPAQLPATVVDFTGREAFVDELCEQLAGARDRATAVVAVAGTGGIGKTTLAVHVAHAARHHFPDGQLYVDLRGAGGSPADTDAVLGGFLRALGTPDAAIPDSPEERAALYRSTLDGRRVLALLDNARDAAQIRPLLPAAKGCAALVTSRARMADLEGAHLVDLDVMCPDEAFALFTQIVGEERAVIEYEHSTRVVAACGFLPLAIRIAASRLATRRTWTVSVLARKLADERRRLDELRAGDLAVKASFELGYGQLEPHQARAFRLLGLADGPDISLAAAAAVLDLPVEETEPLLESLVDISLLESPVPGRYRFHDLVRLYARACAERDERPPAARDAALSRLLDFYLATTARVYAIERPGDRTVDHLQATARAGLTFATPAEAVDWLFAEGDGLIACARQSLGEGMLRRAADLLLIALNLAESGAKLRPYESATEVISEAARADGDLWAEGRARLTRGIVYHFVERFEEADAELRRALEAGLGVGDPTVACRAANQLGITALNMNRQHDAEESFQRALHSFRAIGDEAGEASALSNLARVRLNLGHTCDGLELAEQSLAIYRRLGVSFRLANGMYALGIALTQAGRYDEAVRQFTDALQIFHDSRQQRWEGVTHFRLAETHLAAECPALSAEHAERALALQGIGGVWRRGTFLTLLGRALHAMGQTDRARACWYEALTIYENLGSSEREEVRGLLSGGPHGGGHGAMPSEGEDGHASPSLNLINGTDLISRPKSDGSPAT
ncbi:BTAD domain-containing putative transcriptional regulator [Streptomyces sp. LX-29]|uniref:ATP-binding protein n=1 Tax=Streptomyces sp. LX-29 TaxID=2900152 RepID=UPI00240D4363|nr:BTAD domain-containing putative transcriptional regulator [Streptomyces sp. LX-29]